MVSRLDSLAQSLKDRQISVLADMKREREVRKPMLSVGENVDDTATRQNVAAEYSIE